MIGAGFIFIAVAAVAALLFPAPVRRSLGALTRLVDAIARRPGIAIAACGFLSLAGSLTTAAVFKWPEPKEHDEFCYLLASDTFAHGRLTNPTHPMWRFFETFHVIQEPTYTSKFPPAQGLFLAAGQVAFGHPIAGLWISGALMAAAICWMLYGVLPSRWALLGGLLATARFGIASYWTQSYWGGAVAAMGGALLFGGAVRVARRPRMRDAVLLAAGIAILANSRPFEGLLATIPALVVVATGLSRRPAHRRAALARVLVPMLLVLGPTIAWMALYNRAVTGSALRFPYQVHEQACLVAPLFLWLDAHPLPAYRDEVLRKFYAVDLVAPWLAQRTPSGFLAEALGKAIAAWKFFVGPYLSLAVLATPWLLRRRWMPLAAITLAIVAAGLLAETYYKNHYAAPVAGVIVLLTAGGLRVITAWRPRGRPVGRAVAAAVVLLELVAPVGRARDLRHPPPAEWARAALTAELESTGQAHLVIVRYGPLHVPNFEWVYNDADIDDAAIVWARDRGDAENADLLRYFRSRQVSLLEVGFTKGPPVRKSYPN